MPVQTTKTETYASYAKVVVMQPAVGLCFNPGRKRTKIMKNHSFEQYERDKIMEMYLPTRASS